MRRLLLAACVTAAAVLPAPAAEPPMRLRMTYRFLPGDNTEPCVHPRIHFTADSTLACLNGNLIHLPSCESLGPVLIDHNEAGPVVALSPDGKWIAVYASHMGGLRLWEMPTDRLPGQKRFTPGKFRLDSNDRVQHPAGFGQLDGVAAVTFAPNSRSVAAVTHSGKVRHWDVATGKLLGGCETGGKCIDLAFISGGQELLLWGTSASDPLSVWDLKAKAAENLPQPRGVAYRGARNGVGVSPDGTRGVECEQNVLVVWDFAKRTSAVHKYEHVEVGDVGKGEFVVATRKGAVVRHPNGLAQAGQALQAGRTGQFEWDQMQAVRISPDGRSVIALHTDRRVLLFGTAEVRPLPANDFLPTKPGTRWVYDERVGQTSQRVAWTVTGDEVMQNRRCVRIAVETVGRRGGEIRLPSEFLARTHCGWAWIASTNTESPIARSLPWRPGNEPFLILPADKSEWDVRISTDPKQAAVKATATNTDVDTPLGKKPGLRVEMQTPDETVYEWRFAKGVGLVHFRAAGRGCQVEYTLREAQLPK